jgi:hypothetical protein
MLLAALLSLPSPLAADNILVLGIEHWHYQYQRHSDGIMYYKTQIASPVADALY